MDLTLSERNYDYQHLYELIPNRHLTEIIFLTPQQIKDILEGQLIEFQPAIPYPVFV